MSVFRISTKKALTRSSADDGLLTLFQIGANQVSFSRKWRATIPHYTLGCMLRASSAAGKEGLAGLEHIGTYRNMLSVLLGAPTFRGQNCQMIGMPFAWDTTIRKGGHPAEHTELKRDSMNCSLDCSLSSLHEEYEDCLLLYVPSCFSICNLFLSCWPEPLSWKSALLHTFAILLQHFLHSLAVIECWYSDTCW